MDYIGEQNMQSIGLLKAAETVQYSLSRFLLQL